MFQFKRLSASDAIRLLQQVSCFGMGPQPSRQQMLKDIEKVESEHDKNNPAELEYWLGVAWRNYTAWFVRGDERKAYLEKAIIHFEKAYAIEKSSSGTNWQKFAAELGALLVDESLVRDVERGIPILETLFHSSRVYVPLLCSYAEAIYRTGDFQKAAAVATELHRRAKDSKDWKHGVPPAPMRIAAKAYRAYIKQLKKDGDTTSAVAESHKLMQTGVATDSDRRIHAKLEQSER